MINWMRLVPEGDSHKYSHRIWLKIAKEDLNAAKLLLSQKLYRHAVFYLQQSVEKAVKSLGISNGVITEAQARGDIGHKTVRIYFKIFCETKERLVAMENATLMHPELTKMDFIDLSQVGKLKIGIDDFQKEFSDENVALKISSSEPNLRDFLNRLHKLTEELKNELPRIDKEFKELSANGKKKEDFERKLSRAIEIVSQIRPDALGGSTVRDIVSKSTSPEAIMILASCSKLMIRLSYCYQSLLYSSLILYPHAVRTRYPDNDFNPSDAYNEKALLIRALDALIESIHETLRELDVFYSEASGLSKK